MPSRSKENPRVRAKSFCHYSVDDTLDTREAIVIVYYMTNHLQWPNTWFAAHVRTVKSSVSIVGCDDLMMILQKERVKIIISQNWFDS